MRDSGPLVPWYENMTLFIKPEVHNVSQRRQRRTETWPQATCTKDWWSLATPLLSYVSGKDSHTDTDTCTDTPADIRITIPGKVTLS